MYSCARLPGLSWLYQIQLCCPFDGRTATIDIELAVDALGMRAESAQGDHQFTGDLWPRKLGLEQSEHLKLTVAQRLDEGLRSDGGGDRIVAYAPPWRFLGV